MKRDGNMVRLFVLSCFLMVMGMRGVASAGESLQVGFDTGAAAVVNFTTEIKATISNVSTQTVAGVSVQLILPPEGSVTKLFVNNVEQAASSTVNMGDVGTNTPSAVRWQVVFNQPATYTLTLNASCSEGTVTRNETKNVFRNPNVIIADRNNNRVIELDSDKNIVWEYTNLREPLDAKRLANGNTLITENSRHRVIEVDRDKNIVWQYGITDSAGAGVNQLYSPMRSSRLGNGNTLIADYNNHRTIEVSRDKQIVYKTMAGYYPYDARKLPNGNVLIADMNYNRIIEVDINNNVRWQYSSGLSSPNGVYRMNNDSTLIADTNNNRVIEVDYGKRLVWEYKGLNQPVSAIELSNGNILISDNNNHRVMEVNRDKVILWQYGETGIGGYLQQHLNSPFGCEEVFLPTLGSVVGKVTRDGDSLGLANVTITAIQNNQEKGSTTTSADGGFCLDLLPGTYTISAYTTRCGTQSIENVVVYLGKSTKNINLLLLGLAMGKVTKAGDNLVVLANVIVTAIQNNEEKGSTTTAADGSFCLDLLAGTYTISAYATGYGTQSIENVVVYLGKATKSIDFSLILTATPRTTTTLIVDRGNNRVIEIDSDKNIVWEYTDLRDPLDVKRLANGNTLITEYGRHRVIEVDKDKNIVWQYGITDSAGSGYNQLNAPIRASRLGNGNTLIADYNNHRTIEVSRDKQIVYKTTAGYYPYDARKLPNGNVLIADRNYNQIIEVDINNNVRWEYTGLNYPQGAYRMNNDSTLIADTNNNRVIEVDYAKRLVWEYKGLNQPVSAIELSNGNILISDYNNHRVMEVNKDKVILWQYGETGIGGYLQQHLNSPFGCEEVLSPTLVSVIGTATRLSDRETLTGVTITASQNGMIKGTTATSSDGKYILDLSPGTYTLKASLTGYDSQTKEGIELIAGKSNKMDFVFADMLQYTPIYLPYLDAPTNYFYPVGVYPVRIKIVDPQYPLNPSSLKVYYRINDNTTWNPVSMSSTGADYEYSAIIPQQAAGTRVYYYIEGKDTAGNIITNPGGNPTLNPYQFKVVASNIVSTTPKDNATNVSVASDIKVVFSNPMNPATIGSQTIKIMIGTATVDDVYSCNDKTVIFEPGERLKEETSYRIVVTTQVMDTASNTIPAEYAWTFYTGLLGNLDEYSRVDGRDLIILGGAFGSTPADTNWNKSADFNKEADSRERIDVRDLSALASRFGRSSLLFAPRLLAPSLPPLTTSKTIIKLASSKTEVLSANQEITVRALIDNATNLYSYGFDLIFDSSKFEVTKVKEGDFLNQDAVDTSFMYVQKEGKIIIGASRLGEVSGISGSGILAEFTLKAKESAPINFTLQKLSIEDANLTLMKEVEIINLEYANEPTQLNFNAFCYPNPAKDKKVTFKFDLPKNATINIEVFNVAGEKMKEIKEYKTAGSGKTIDCILDVASGIYIYLIKAEYDTGGSEKVTGKLGVVK